MAHICGGCLHFCGFVHICATRIFVEDLRVVLGSKFFWPHIFREVCWETWRSNSAATEGGGANSRGDASGLFFSGEAPFPLFCYKWGHWLLFAFFGGKSDIYIFSRCDMFSP